jgi:menaquinol-cytochrome c reductase iron-sulfur subunit
MSEHNSPGEMPRRSFLNALAAIGSAIMAAILGIPIVRAALFPMFDRASGNPWSSLGPLDNFKNLAKPLTQPLTSESRDGWSLANANRILYVCAGPDGQPRVLSSVCPHLGCTVQWRAEQDNFHCPCHGGTFAPDGTRISGPPARGMDELPTRVQDGHLYVQFQTYRELLADKEPAD